MTKIGDNTENKMEFGSLDGGSNWKLDHPNIYGFNAGKSILIICLQTQLWFWINNQIIKHTTACTTMYTVCAAQCTIQNKT